MRDLGRQKVSAGAPGVVVTVPATGDSTWEKNLSLTLAMLGLLAGPTVERWKGVPRFFFSHNGEKRRWSDDHPSHRPNMRLSEEQTLSTGQTQGA